MPATLQEEPRHHCQIMQEGKFSNTSQTVTWTVLLEGQRLLCQAGVSVPKDKH